MGPAVTSSRRARSLGAVAGAALGSLVVLPSRLALILAELNGGDISNSDTTSRLVAGTSGSRRRPGWVGSGRVDDHAAIVGRRMGAAMRRVLLIATVVFSISGIVAGAIWGGLGCNRVAGSSVWRRRGRHPQRGSRSQGFHCWVAIGTLVVAAGFNTVRRRIQDAVDRRFKRSRYDAQHVMEQFAGSHEVVIEEFTGSLPDRVDPGAFLMDWVSVVNDAVQPSHSTVWVKDGSSP